MEKSAYYSHTPAQEKPPIVVPLPPLKEGDVLSFNGSLFSDRHGKPLELSESEALSSQSCANLPIGKAYDGLPLILSISRERRIKSSILSQLGVESESALHPSILTPLLALEEAVQTRACATGLIETDKLGTSTSRFYKTHSDVGCLIQNTFLAQLLSDSSTSSLNERGEGYKEALLDKKTTMHIGVPLLAQKDPPLKYCKPLSVKTRLTTEDIPEEERGTYSLEPLFLESFVGVLPSTRFQCAQDWSVASDPYYSSFGTGNRVYEGLVSDRKSYLHALSLSRSVSFLIDRHEVLSRVIVPLARDAFITMHSKQRVHGDIKPANVLLIEGAPKLIDVRGCSIGGISSTYTPEWCAPEQILGKPLDASADVYAIAMMISAVLGGQIYGEVKNFRMPAATGDASQTVQVLDTEGVWLESGSGLNEETRNVWREALARFLSFKSDKRPADGKALADELEKLLGTHPIKGMKPLKVSGGMGSSNLKRLKLDSAVSGIGSDQLSAVPQLNQLIGWVLDDNYPNVV